MTYLCPSVRLRPSAYVTVVRDTSTDEERGKTVIGDHIMHLSIEILSNQDINAP